MAYLINRGTKSAPIWYARYKDIDNKWKNRKTDQPTKQEAQKWLDHVVARVRQGLIGMPDPAQAAAAALTVDELCERFLKEYSRPKIRNLAKYREYGRAMVNQAVKRFPIASMPAAKLRPADVARWRDELIADGYAPNTVNRILSLLHVIFKWGLDSEILPPGRNPSSVERLPAKPSEAHYTLQEVYRLLARPDCPVMLAAALYTSMRKGELFGLTWDCVRLDQDPPRLEVRRSYAGPPKSGKPRTCPVHPELVPILRAYRERAPTGDDPHGLVFPVEQTAKHTGRPLGTYRMGNPQDMLGIRKLLEAVNVNPPDDPWHAARHTAATHMLEACKNEHAVSLMLGHSTGGAGARVTTGYTHASIGYLYRELCKMTLKPPAADGVADLTERRRQKAARE